MLKFIEVTGKNEEEAIAKALEQLALLAEESGEDLESFLKALQGGEEQK